MRKNSKKNKRTKIITKISDFRGFIYLLEIVADIEIHIKRNRRMKNLY
jgi:hypothetical protein